MDFETDFAAAAVVDDAAVSMVAAVAESGDFDIPLLPVVGVADRDHGGDNFVRQWRPLELSERDWFGAGGSSRHCRCCTRHCFRKTAAACCRDWRPLGGAVVAGSFGTAVVWNRDSEKHLVGCFDCHVSKEDAVAEVVAVAAGPQRVGESCYRDLE